MKIIAFFLFSFFLLSLLMIEAVCAVQRLSDIRPGVPCDKIPATEKRLGSREFTTNDAPDVSRYTGTLGGEIATVVYLCDKGRLNEQKIIVTFTTRDEAYRFANEQKMVLTMHLGDPIHDGPDMGVWEKLWFAFKGGDLDYLSIVVVWGRAKEDVMLLVKERGNNLWEITISQGSSKLEYILNS